MADAFYVSYKAAPAGSFAFFEAEGDTCAKSGRWDKACDAYSQALGLKPGHVNILLSRSKGFIQLGRPDLALKDADDVLKANPQNYHALHAKAEALFAAGDFEYALMYYHRGNHIRPEAMFRLGIQKCEQAISDSVAQDFYNPPVPTSVSGRRSTTLSETMRSSISRASAVGTNRTAPGTLPVPPPNAAPADKKTQRKLLGELSSDREYLESLAADSGLATLGIHEIARNGLEYLDTRQEFWRQQNPPGKNKPQSRASRPSTSLSGFTTGSATASSRDLGASRSRGAPAATGERGAKGTQKKALSRQKYLEQTRYAIQTLENVNAAIDYGDPELGLKFAKGFLSRLATLEIPDKPRILGNLYSCMGITYMELGKLTLAAIHHRKDLDIAVKYNYKDAYLRALGNLGMVYQRMGDYSQAIAMYDKKLTFGDENDAPKLCESIGHCYFEAGDYMNAIQYAERSIKTSQVVEDAEQQMLAYLLHGQAMSMINSGRDALVSFERALELARGLDNASAQATALTHMANTLLQLGEVQRSIELQQQALEISAALNQDGEGAAGAPPSDGTGAGAGAGARHANGTSGSSPSPRNDEFETDTVSGRRVSDYDDDDDDEGDD